MTQDAFTGLHNLVPRTFHRREQDGREKYLALAGDMTTKYPKNRGVINKSRILFQLVLLSAMKRPGNEVVAYATFRKEKKAYDDTNNALVCPNGLTRLSY